MELSDKIYQILIKKKYSRGEPNLSVEIVARINKAITQNKPIRFIGYWGVGSKDTPNWADKESIAFLSDVRKEIAEIYTPSIEFTFIFATCHGVHNGYVKECIDSYIQEMTQMFKHADFKYMTLDPLWNKYGISSERIEAEFKNKKEGWWEQVAEHKKIEKSASHRNRKHSPVLAAQKYFIMRDMEKEMFKNEFPGYIFHAFSDPVLKGVLPNMPTFYFWGTKKYHSDAPWFTDFKKNNTHEKNMESYISPKTAKGLPSKIHGKGFFSVAYIKKDEIVAIKKGEIVPLDFLNESGIGGGVGLQVSDTEYMAPLTKEEYEKSMVYINYSCEPNLGMRGQNIAVAFRDIQPNEELTLDYAMLFNNDDSFECNCGNINCRHQITGRDWMKPELQEKYKGYFTEYIQSKIDNL